MTGFDYQPQLGFLEAEWLLRVSGYEDDDLNGQLDLPPPHGLVESEVNDPGMDTRDARETGAYPTRIHGAYGWRQFEFDNGAVHRYAWEHVLIDMRCGRCKSPDADLFMVTEELWDSSGLDGGRAFGVSKRQSDGSSCRPTSRVTYPPTPTKCVMVPSCGRGWD